MIELFSQIVPPRYIYQAPEASDLGELRAQFKENTGFLIVRHPFVRLVSAYEDKMLSPHPFPYAYHRRYEQKSYLKYIKVYHVTFL